jgi:hypothetical protein
MICVDAKKFKKCKTCVHSVNHDPLTIDWCYPEWNRCKGDEITEENKLIN